MLSGHNIIRSASRSMRSLRPSTRGVATHSAAGPSRQSAAWSSYSIAAAAAVGVGAATYSLSSRSAAIRCESRQAWHDRLKPKESKGDVFLHNDAHTRHAPSAAHDEHVEPAEETPAAIEVAVEESEEQTGQQSAYDPDTGEINWDCPCLGGMAHGPCGEHFKLAFSCFVYSEAEPKGIDCVDKFKAMQDCFREHPDVYKDEIEDDEAANAHFEKEEAEAKSEDSTTAKKEESVENNTTEHEEKKSDA
ncbi:probable Mitochondrial intermembrane space import and assembly protein 40 [Melanopsichium pennsylvanicum]|uniref:Mitochondrial intermembrane space import and assembly protein 40 n=2 Tax=Melanopsichium pennsylvanicum TaxID=63383 RepID=A0AAJ4XQC5_9BASI|nr:related to MIA40-mitochondrial intermembrane space protein, involved in import and assembly of intermembrane space proteins [Melanopsichium pennsylvanicum 4]SNX86016.1 probable Mitochondrial intermembrane space import and assembly protein 40 [Melanopsichium pennsylvanicum]